MTWQAIVYGELGDIEPVVAAWANQQEINLEKIEIFDFQITTSDHPAPRRGTKICVNAKVNREQRKQLKNMLIPTVSPRIYYWP